MYKINFYREADEVRRTARRQTMKTAFMTGLIVLELFLTGSLGLSALLLGEQASGLRAEVARLERKGLSSSEKAGLDVARELLQIRKDRIDWSPKLASLSQILEPSLTLTRLSGQSAMKSRGARLSFSGVAADPAYEMRAVSDLVARMRQDRRLYLDLPQIRLGTVGGAGSGEFEVVCEAPGKKP